MKIVASSDPGIQDEFTKSYIFVLIKGEKSNIEYPLDFLSYKNVGYVECFPSALLFFKTRTCANGYFTSLLCVPFEDRKVEFS